MRRRGSGRIGTRCCGSGDGNLALCVPGTAHAAPSRMDVVIIGAGAAGIAAANKLRACGYGTLILEARERIGGRIWTLESDSGPVELGAEFVHGRPIRPFL